MGRHINPVCRLCRREGIKLFLKGTRCDSPKCAIDRKTQKTQVSRDCPPGMHTRRGKQSEYGVRLREKQKLKRFYGLFERQFRRYFELASRSTENTGEVLLTLLERRLDNIIYRLGWAMSRAGARQLVSHGHIHLNGRLATIPSMLVKANDTLSVKNSPRSLALVRVVLASNPPKAPDYLEQTGTEPPTARVRQMPTRSDVDPHIADIQENLIIEVSSR